MLTSQSDGSKVTQHCQLAMVTHVEAYEIAGTATASAIKAERDL